MQTHYNVKERPLRFTSSEADMKQSHGFQANEASDIINHVMNESLDLVYSMPDE